MGTLNVKPNKSSDGTSVLQVKYNGSYVSKVKLNLTSGNNHGYGWLYNTGLGSEQKQTTYYAQTRSSGGYSGTKVIWDYAHLSNYSSTAYNLFPNPMIGYVCSYPDRNSSHYSPDYNMFRDGSTMRSKAYYSSSSLWYIAQDPRYAGWTVPTIKYYGSSNVNQVINQPINTDLNMSWGVNDAGVSVLPEWWAQREYFIYKKPWLPDQTLRADFLSTPNVWHPGPNNGTGSSGNTTGTVVLKQPSMWGNIAITNGTSTTGAGYNDGRTIYGIWQSDTYDVQFHVMVYVPLTRWDSLSDLQSVGINWHLDLPGMNPSSQSGVIKNNFVEMSNLPGYYIGHQPITLPMGLNTVSAKLSFAGPFNWQDSARDNEKTYSLII